MLMIFFVKINIKNKFCFKFNRIIWEKRIEGCVLTKIFND